MTGKPDDPRVSGAPYVLIVDDSPENRTLAKEQLGFLGYEARAVASAQEAILVCRDVMPALILMDCQLGGIDGFRATALIRRISKGADVPILALTAETKAEVEAKCRVAGMNGVIQKPASLALLACEIDELLGPRSARGDMASDPDGRGAERAEIIGIFLERLDGRLERIRTAVAAGYSYQVSAGAHALRSAASVIGDAWVMAACSDLETSAEQGLDSADRIVADLLAAADALRETLTL